MTLPDVNIWLALSLSGHPHHPAARDWLGGEADPSGVRFCRATQQGLVRLLTTAAVLAPFGIPPLTNRAAWGIIGEFMADDRIDFAAEPDGVEARWKTWALRDTASPKLWMDAWLAAVAHRLEAQFVTVDKAFTQFSGLDLLILGTNHPQKK
ncbi:type II toxin-antitoxin system VapC family toxin [soil metagenome]